MSSEDAEKHPRKTAGLAREAVSRRFQNDQTADEDMDAAEQALVALLPQPGLHSQDVRDHFTDHDAEATLLGSAHSNDPEELGGLRKRIRRLQRTVQTGLLTDEHFGDLVADWVGRWAEHSDESATSSSGSAQQGSETSGPEPARRGVVTQHEAVAIAADHLTKASQAYLEWLTNHEGPIWSNSCGSEEVRTCLVALAGSELRSRGIMPETEVKASDLTQALADGVRCADVAALHWVAHTCRSGDNAVSVLETIAQESSAGREDQIKSSLSTLCQRLDSDDVIYILDRYVAQSDRAMLRAAGRGAARNDGLDDTMFVSWIVSKVTSDSCNNKTRKLVVDAWEEYEEAGDGVPPALKARLIDEAVGAMLIPDNQGASRQALRSLALLAAAPREAVERHADAIRDAYRKHGQDKHKACLNAVGVKPSRCIREFFSKD